MRLVNHSSSQSIRLRWVECMGFTTTKSKMDPFRVYRQLDPFGADSFTFVQIQRPQGTSRIFFNQLKFVLGIEFLGQIVFLGRRKPALQLCSPSPPGLIDEKR